MRKSSTVQFGVFEANLETGELRKRGVRIRLPDQAFQVLSMLLESPGELVSREDIKERLWHGNTFGDFDAGLNKAVNRLREALGDSAANPRFIETVAKRGYRLLAPLASSAGDLPTQRGPVKVRLAVLPFENLSAEPEQEFFSDGLTEEMIAELGRLNPKRLGVIARTSAMLYKRSRKRIDEIGRELDVDYILEGSVRKAEQRARITAQLIQVEDETHLWAESYDRELADILRVQNDVARRVAESLAFELLPEDVAGVRRVSPEAHEAYLRGRFFWNENTGNGAHSAIAWFEQCLALDPGYALAYSGMADCYGRLGWFGELPAREAGAKAKAAAGHALRLQEGLGEAHASMALVAFWHEWDWAEAERELRLAIALKPNYAAAHNWYAAFLNVMLRFEEAAFQQKIAEELDPLSLTIAMNAADPYYFARRYEPAVACFRQVLARDNTFFPAHYNLGRTYLQAGMFREAIASFELAAELSGVPQAKAALAQAYARLGEREKAQSILTDLEQLAKAHSLPCLQMVLVFLGLGDHPRALAAVEQAWEERAFGMVYLQADPVYDELRVYPEFGAMLERMKFPLQTASGAEIPRGLLESRATGGRHPVR